MARPIINVVNCATGETEVREMNDEEFAHWEAISGSPD